MSLREKGIRLEHHLPRFAQALQLIRELKPAELMSTCRDNTIFIQVYSRIGGVRVHVCCSLIATKGSGRHHPGSGYRTVPVGMGTEPTPTHTLEANSLGAHRLGRGVSFN